MRKRGMFKGIVTGAMIGAAAATAVGMMNKRTHNKLRRFAVNSSQKIVDKATELFGK